MVYNLQEAIDKDIADGTLVPVTDSAQHRIDAKESGTYDIYIEIDCDCEELLDAIGLDYKVSADDDTQNEVCISLNVAEFKDVFSVWSLIELNEVLISEILLNPELGEYTSKVTIYKPSGDIISFY